jgi:hypothetical protein
LQPITDTCSRSIIRLPVWLSDALCRLASGSSFAAGSSSATTRRCCLRRRARYASSASPQSREINSSGWWIHPWRSAGRLVWLNQSPSKMEERSCQPAQPGIAHFLNDKICSRRLRKRSFSYRDNSFSFSGSMRPTKSGKSVKRSASVERSFSRF